MRITKPRDSEDPQKLQRKLAFVGCDKCPECGEMYNIETDENTHYLKHMFWYEYKDITEFVCKNCGCHYETDPYNKKAEPIDTDFIKFMVWFFTIVCIILGSLFAYDSKNFTGIMTIIGIITYIIGLIMCICGNIIIYLCDNIYKKYSFNDVNFVPIEKHYSLEDITTGIYKDFNSVKIDGGK